MVIVDKVIRVISSTRFIVIAAVIVAAVTFGAWQYHNTTNVNRVFWGMVDNSLKTSAYTRHSQQSQGSQSVDQIFQTATSPQHRLFSDTVFTQTGVDSARAVTENIGTPTSDYVRYTDIQTAQKLDFSSVLNVWGVTEPEVKDSTSGQLYNQAILSVVPIGNLDSSQRREIIKIMKEKNAYSYELVETKRSLPFGRPTYTMQLTISPVGYISALKQYAQTVGLNHLNEVEPETYAEAQKITAIIKIDGWSRQMISIDQSGGAKTEQLSGWNLKKTLPKPPAEAIPVDELQAKLQSIE